MLIVDLNKSDARFIVTVTEATTVTSPVYTMMVESPFMKGTYHMALPANTSPYKQRYDEFFINTSEFAGFGLGLYAYTITELTDGVVEEGVLLIKNSDPLLANPYTVITPNESDDDFIVYNPIN